MSSSIFQDLKTTTAQPSRAPRSGRVPVPKPMQRAYAAASVSNLLSDWISTNNSQDIEGRLAIRYIRNRARDLERNDDYTRKFLRDLEANVVGHSGFKLTMKVKTTRGKLNASLNQQIETAYNRARKLGNWDVTGRLSGVDFDKLVIRSVARDGECLIRKIPGYDNDFKFSLQLIEADQLDENYVWNLAPNIYIRMGVEMNEWRRPIAYHLWKQHPGDLFPDLQRIRIQADEFIHPFVIERIGQSRGISWMCSSAVRLRHLSKYEESEVIAARIAAAKMGFFERTGEQEYVGDGQDDSGNIVTEVNPGVFENLPIGVSLKTFDPQHPNANYGDFRKGVLRGIACGLGVSYNTSFGDLEGVNFSSLRAGELDERDLWMGLQGWFVSHVIEPTFLPWLKMAIVAGQIKNVSIQDAEELAEYAYWRGRRWQWVDPLKDVQANLEAINGGMESRTNVIESQGRDRDEVFDEIADDNSAAKDRGIEFLSSIKDPKATGKEPQDPQEQVDSGEPKDESRFSFSRNGHTKA